MNRLASDTMVIQNAVTVYVSMGHPISQHTMNFI